MLRQDPLVNSLLGRFQGDSGFSGIGPIFNPDAVKRWRQGPKQVPLNRKKSTGTSLRRLKDTYFPTPQEDYIQPGQFEELLRQFKMGSFESPFWSKEDDLSGMQPWERRFRRFGLTAY